MNRHRRRLPALTPAVAALVLGVAAQPGAAQRSFDEANVFFELNNTDGDLGIHALIDGEPWRKLEIELPNGVENLEIVLRRKMAAHGLTELFFESAEPPFDELDPEDFFDRFPEGEYEVRAITLEGKRLRDFADVTHVMPAPPAPTVNGSPMAEQCDEEEPDFDATETSAPITIAWPAVTMSHPDSDGGGAGIQPPVPVVIHNYEVVFEMEIEVGGEEFTAVSHIILPPGDGGMLSVMVPPELIALGDEFKYEVLAREEGYNQTATESCFVLGD